jgi:hypothetical protein
MKEGCLDTKNVAKHWIKNFSYCLENILAPMSSSEFKTPSRFVLNFSATGDELSK